MATKPETRAGHYIAQKAGYRAFIPSPLPPVPPVRMDDGMHALISRADTALGRLDGVASILPNPDLFVAMYVRREAVLSSQLEGTQATLLDVLGFEAEAVDSGRPQDVEEVVNYVAAMNSGLARLDKLPVSLRLIREIHAKLMAGVRGGERSPGEFRTTQNWIGPAGSTIAPASYVPPPRHEMSAGLGELVKFIHDEAPMPALVKVGLVHAQFETIHPFLDGNGRVGRLLVTFLLCEREILRRPLLYLSWYFKRNRTEYYERLQAVRDRGDWESWIGFFLKGVHVVAQEATETARRILALREHDRHLVTEKLGRRAGPALALLETLFLGPLVSANSVAEATETSFENANDLVKRLVDVGILEETTGRRRNRRFAYSRYIALLKDD